MGIVASQWADRYITDFLLPGLARYTGVQPAVDEVRSALRDPYLCLRSFLGFYAFSRRGKDRVDTANAAVAALDEVMGDNPKPFLLASDASAMWAAFEEQCTINKRKPQEQLNVGLVAGIPELAQEIFRSDGVGSIAEWIEGTVVRTSRIEDQFMRIVDIRGVGPKVASVFLRDIVFLFSLEDQIDPIDRLYVQPLDKWTRTIAPAIIEEPGIDHSADWILAGKMAKYTRKSGISGVRFNMGVAALGAASGNAAEFLEHLPGS
jgi:hypothetical protein